MPLSNSMLGRLGQQVLATWAAQASITANPPQHDEKGWDFFLQLAPEGFHSGPLDRTPPELSCMVQIKTTTGIETSEPITLSNWRRMCTDPVPWFVLALRVDPESREVASAHLVHVDERWCARVLKRLREATRDGKLELHEQTLNVKWSESDALVALGGAHLRARIVGHLAGGQHAYVTEKLRWFTDLGYDDRRRRVRVVMRAADEASFFSHMADLGVGIVTTLPPAWRATITDLRFGIEAPLQEFDAQHGEMEFRAPSQGRVALTLTSRSGTSVSLDCDVFRSQAVFPFLPKEYDLTRFLAEGISILVSPISEGEHRGIAMTFAFSFPSDEIPFSQLRARAALASAFARHVSDPVTVSIGVGDRSVAMAPDHVPDLGPEFRDMAEKVASIVAVCTHFGLPEDTLVSPRDLIEQGRMAAFMATMLDGRGGELVSPFTSTVPVGHVFGLITEAALYLDQQTLATVAGAWGVVTQCREVPGKGAQVFVKDGSVTTQHLILRPPDEAADQAILLARRRVREVLEQSGCAAICDPEVMKLIQGGTAVDHSGEDDEVLDD